MHHRLHIVHLLAHGLMGIVTVAAAAEAPFGLTQRVPMTTSRVHGRPEPPPPLKAPRVFPKIAFEGPTVIATAPGTDRIFVGERLGKIFSIPNNPDVAQADLFVDCRELANQIAEKEKVQVDFDSLYGLTFDPKFAENRYCYVCYVVKRREGRRGSDPEGTRVTRLRVNDTNPPQCEMASETPIISWLSGGHNGGCLKFGPDGCLYISTGDGSTAFPPDEHNTGQDVSDLLSSILRIDVHPPDASRPYSIPADNPFVSLDKARGEVWAYGVRNPWKMSFDRQTGDLWAGDVGWELWELVYRVRKGENYGWSLVEGRQPVHAERALGPTPIVPPTIEISHEEGASVTGGFVYRGQQFPELVGTYIFGDWETRRIWGVKVEGEKLGPRYELVESTVRIVDFAEDAAGELYLLDNDAGTIHTLARNDVQATHEQFPRKLSETGLLTSVAEHRVAPGVIPFEINAAHWADHAVSERFLAVPGTESIKLHAKVQNVPGSQFSRLMDFPAETVLMKTLSLEMTHGDPASRRRIETQLLHYDGRDWRGYSYQWNDAQTDATLVDALGTTKKLSVHDSQAPGGRRTQTWSFASRMECIRCHNPWSEYTLAFNLPQINRSHNYGSASDNQIRTLRHLGVLQDVSVPDRKKPDAPVAAPKSHEQLPRLADPRETSADLNDRARAYLHVNCAYCHRFNGGGSAHIYLQHDLPLKSIKAVGLRPTLGTFGIRDAQILAPGEPFRSVLLFRLSKTGPGHMPHIGAKIIDSQGVSLVHDWIASLPNEAKPVVSLERLPPKTASESESARAIERLLVNPSQALLLAYAVHEGRLSKPQRQAAIDAGLKQSDLAIRDLFEPFLPEEQRTQRLGEAVRPDDILKLAGDALRGRQLFHESTVVQCRSCHRSEGKGIELGPELSQIGKKLDRHKLLDSILQPSAAIDPKYVMWMAETKDGLVVTGLLAERTEAEVVLRDAQNKLHRLATADIEGLFPQRKSLMPDLLLRDLTIQQVADLLSYLDALK